MRTKHFQKSMVWLFLGVCVLVDTHGAGAQSGTPSIHEGQLALKRGQLKFYEQAKANPKATPQELAQIRDTAQREGTQTWARAVTGAIQQLFTKGSSSNKPSPSGVAPTGAQGPTAPQVQPKKTGFSSGPAEPGIDGSQVPGMLEFPGAKKP